MNTTYCICEQCGSRVSCVKDELDILFQVMDNENDVTLTDGEGIVLRVSDSYWRHYGVSEEDIIGKSVYDLEKTGVFKPSVTAAVLREKKKVTLLQENKFGAKVLSTGVPVFDENGNIKHVISFNSIDIADMSNLYDNYNKVNELMKEYVAELQQLKMKDMKDSVFVAKSKVMENIDDLIAQVSDIEANVLITGETGVGKSMIAKLIHSTSSRAEGAFIEINCGAIPSSLLESELFGYEAGAFTGASPGGKIGKIELAEKGTLFLDEIGELSSDMQVKLLQVIQSKEMMRVGGLEKIKVDFRLVAATNKDLERSIQTGDFREDLYYRLNVISINVPPLRERCDDIIPLIMTFLKRFNIMYNKNLSFSNDALQVLEAYSWPGNIRQVENFIERMVVTFRGETADLEHLPRELYSGMTKTVKLEGETLEEMMEAYEKEIFLKALEKYRSSVGVSKALGISQTTAARKLRKYAANYGRKNSHV